MIDEKINKTLSELEANLRNIESARKQVESTINSYDGLKTETANYVKTLSAIKDNLNLLISAIGEDYENNTKSFRGDCKAITDSCNSLISKIDNSIEETKSEVFSQFEKFNKKFTYAITCNVIIWITLLVLFFISK